MIICARRSPDGLTLIVSSQDGYCSVVSFEPDELGNPYIAPVSANATVEHAHVPSTVPTKADEQRPTKLVHAASSITTTGASTGEKREGEGAAGDEERARKKGKRATLISRGPIA